MLNLIAKIKSSFWPNKRNERTFAKKLSTAIGTKYQEKPKSLAYFRSRLLQF